MRTVVSLSRPLPGLKLAAALVAAVAFSGTGFAQSRLSLADRVAKLESQANNTNAQATQMELLQRLNDLQAEIQQLRSQLETQGFELEQLKKRQRDQYLDLDARLRSQTGQSVRPNPTSMGDMPVSEPVQDAGAFTPATTPTAPVASTPSVPAGNERADYDVAFDALKRGQYSDASKKFEAFLAKYPSSQSTDVATYWLGESYYVTQRYSQALKTFQGVLANYPQSKKAPDSLLKVGFCHYQLGDKAKATSTLKTVIERYPDQPVAKLAEGRLRMLQLN
jgi:tol-pal system protein YbgF